MASRSDEDMVKTIGDISRYKNANQVYIHFGGDSLSSGVVSGHMKSWALSIDDKLHGLVANVATDRPDVIAKIIYDWIERGRVK